MKKHLLVAIFFSVFHFSFGQNWSVISLTDKFNYRLDNDQIITATVWIDSVEVNGNDSVFYLNRIMCDTCVTIIGGPNPCDTCYAARNRPQFFQRQATVSANGVVNFRDTGNVVLNTFAQLNDSWLFDSTWNISATVIAVGMDSVFGSYDSTKTVLLSSGDTISFSNNFGVLKYPRNYGQNSYYRLVGIEGRNLGEQVPKFADFFNFDVGDMFEYHKTGGSAECYRDARRKYTITSKQVNSDTIIYGIQGIYREELWPVGWWVGCASGFWHYSFTSTLTYVDSEDHFLNNYNREAFNLSNRLQLIFELYQNDPVSPCGNNDSAYDRVNIYQDSNFVTSKSFGISYGNWGWGHEYNYHYTEFNYSDTLYIDPSFNGDNFWAFTSTYKLGLGVTDYVATPCFEGIDIDHMVAYSKGGDTVGVFTPDSMFSVGIQKQLTRQITIFPNPATSTLYVNVPGNTLSEITLTNIQGKILLKAILKDFKAELDVTHIESGFYFITINSSTGIFSKKVLIQH